MNRGFRPAWALNVRSITDLWSNNVYPRVDTEALSQRRIIEGWGTGCGVETAGRVTRDLCEVSSSSNLRVSGRPDHRILTLPSFSSTPKTSISPLRSPGLKANNWSSINSPGRSATCIFRNARFPTNPLMMPVNLNLGNGEGVSGERCSCGGCRLKAFRFAMAW